MSFKALIRIIFSISVITLSIQKSVSVSSGKMCNLGVMRDFASHACSHISSPREKREISNEIWKNSKKKASSKSYHLGEVNNEVKLRRKDFPEGGYIIVNHIYAKILSQRNLKPKYNVIKSNSKKNHKFDYRKKRANIESISITYCCFHNCSALEICLAGSV